MQPTSDKPSVNRDTPHNETSIRYRHSTLFISRLNSGDVYRAVWLITNHTHAVTSHIFKYSGIAAASVAIVAFALSSCGGRDKIEVSAAPVASTIKTDNPTLKVFIENSGSMDGYMCAGSQLKDAVYDYVSELNRGTDTTGLYYINSVILPYKGNLTDYIKDLTPESFHQAGGNTSNTDLGNIIANVLQTVNDTTVSMFVSDCILDLPSKDAQKFLTNCEIRIKNEIINAKKRVPSLGVEVLQLNSDFSGKYFYPNGTVEVLKDVKRPYYIWIFGDKNSIAKLNTDAPLSLLSKYGLTGVASFTNESAVPFEIKNKTLTSQTIVPANGAYDVTIRADFRSTLQPDDEILNKQNYSFNNQGIVLNGVYPVTDKNSSYTHYVKFTIPTGVNIAQESLTFNSPQMPVWVANSNDESGAGITKNLSKTTGIKYLIQGVADAYNRDQVVTKMIFSVKRK